MNFLAGEVVGMIITTAVLVALWPKSLVDHSMDGKTVNKINDIGRYSAACEPDD